MLPSERSARTLLLEGFGPALPGIGANMLERTSLILIGLRLAGVREKRIMLAGILAAAVVELGVIAYVARQLKGEQPGSLRPTFPQLTAPTP